VAPLFKPALATVPIILTALGLYSGRDELGKPYVLSNYYACERRWDDILALGRRLPKGRINVFVNHDVLRALYHTGRLPHDMFTFPLNPLAVAGPEPLERTLAGLLEQNPRTKMAFEYLMACYLLTGKVDKVTENLHRVDDLGYRTPPTLYEEAALIHYVSQRHRPDVGQIKISPETIKRYQRFVQIRSAMTPQNQREMLSQLIREFGASYFFYFAFDAVGQL